MERFATRAAGAALCGDRIELLGDALKFGGAAYSSKVWAFVKRFISVLICVLAVEETVLSLRRSKPMSAASGGASP
jgi:hypothetical protein